LIPKKKFIIEKGKKYFNIFKEEHKQKNINNANDVSEQLNEIS
jgi:hypothetical protein